MKTLVLGIGNLLLCDEGVGVHVARALQQQSLPRNVVTLEVGTAFLDALPQIEQADRIVIVDAMKGEHPPGTIYRVPFDNCAWPECIASLHGLDLSRVFLLANRDHPVKATVIGVEPARIAWSTELSPEMQAVFPRVVEAVKEQIRRPS